MSGAPIDVDFQNPLNLMNPSLNQFNPHQVNNQQLAQQRGNPQHQFSPQQIQQTQQRLTTPMPTQGSPMQMQQTPYLQPGQELPPALNRAPPMPSQTPNLTPDQQARINQINNMTSSSFQQQMNRISQMNDQILAHRMSNMSSYQAPPPSLNQQQPQMAGQNNQAGNHVSFPQQVPSDHAPMIHPGTNNLSNQQPAGQEPQSYESPNVGSNYASLEMESTMPNIGKTLPPQQPNSQALNNYRNCNCKAGQTYCAACQLCGMPGHERSYPGPFNWRGRWCDPHYEREKREAMKKYPDAFQQFQAPHQPNPDSAGGANFTAFQAKLQRQAITPQRPYQVGGGRAPPNQPQPPIHHPDRSLGTPRGLDKSSPYTLNAHNVENYKGNNNPFVLSRTTVDRSMFNKKENIDFAGYNAQGEKVRDRQYYNNTPGRQNEFDYYREYKKLNNSDFVPSNQDTIGQQYRPFQSGIPPKRVKLNKDTLPR